MDKEEMVKWCQGRTR